MQGHCQGEWANRRQYQDRSSYEFRRILFGKHLRI